MPTGEAAAQAAQRREPNDDRKPVDKGKGSVAGNLTDDPELRYTANGKPVVKLRVATADRIRDDRTGDWKDCPTAFYTINCWGTLAENCAEVLFKGDRVVAEGTWWERSWDGNDGEVKTVVELTARDLGPSMMFRCARPVRPERRSS